MAEATVRVAEQAAGQILVENLSRTNGAGDEVVIQRTADTFQSGEVLASQAGADGVLTFTFATTMHMVVVEADGLVEAYADPFGGTPASGTGIPCRDEVPVHLPVVTSSVKVYAPTGTTVHVWGFRYDADT